MPEPLTVSIREAARLTGLSRATIYRYLDDGAFEALKTGRRILIVYASLKAWLEALAGRGDGRGR